MLRTQWRIPLTTIDARTNIRSIRDEVVVDKPLHSLYIARW